MIVVRQISFQKTQTFLTMAHNLFIVCGKYFFLNLKNGGNVFVDNVIALFFEEYDKKVIAIGASIKNA